MLEILEDIAIDDRLVEAVAGLVRGGYRLALDDFEFEERWRPLLELAHIVKIDVNSLGLERVREHIEALAGFQVELLAEKVETAAEYEALRTLGFHYYQGYFFASPTVMSATRLPANRLAVLELFAVLQDPDIEMEETGAVVAQDPSLSYRLLRFINCAAVGIPGHITTIQRAVIYVGLASVRRWVTLMVLAGMSDKPSELIRLALTRARMTERICAHAGTGDPGGGSRGTLNRCLHCRTSSSASASANSSAIVTVFHYRVVASLVAGARMRTAIMAGASECSREGLEASSEARPRRTLAVTTFAVGPGSAAARGRERSARAAGWR